MAKASHQIENYLDRLYGYALSLSGNKQDSMDLVQECATRAMAAKKVPADNAAYRAWLFRILRNIFLDTVRKLQYEPINVEEAAAELVAPEIWHCELTLVSDVTVRMGMDKLSTNQRDVISLIDIAGLSYSEAANVLGIPEGTVMSRLSRARRVLIGHISADNVHPFPLKRGKNSK